MPCEFDTGDKPTGPHCVGPVSYTHLRAHETLRYLVCRLLLDIPSVDDQVEVGHWLIRPLIPFFAYFDHLNDQSRLIMLFEVLSPPIEKPALQDAQGAQPFEIFIIFVQQAVGDEGASF